MAKIIDIFEILVTKSSTQSTFVDLKKSIVSYFNKCSVLLSKFGFEAVLQTLVENYKKNKLKSVRKSSRPSRKSLAANHVLEQSVSSSNFYPAPKSPMLSRRKTQNSHVGKNNTSQLSQGSITSSNHKNYKFIIPEKSARKLRELRKASIESRKSS
jgi:hypothetical protein